MGEGVEGSVEAQRGGDEIDEGRFVGDLCVVEKACAMDGPGAPVDFDAPPVVRALEDVLAVFGDFEFDDDEPPVMAEG